MRHGPLLAATVALALALFLAAAPPALGALQISGSRAATVEAVEGVDGYDALVTAAFLSTEAGSVYAKLLTLSDNAVHDGNEAHGEVSADHDEGVAGWWVEFRLLGADGGAATDANGDEVPIPWSVEVDGTPTPLVDVAASQEYLFGVNVHAPADAFEEAESHKVYVALAFRAAPGGGDASGGTMDEARSFAIILAAPGAGPDDDAGVPPDEGDTGGDDERAGGGSGVDWSRWYPQTAVGWAMVVGGLAFAVVLGILVLILVELRRIRLSAGGAAPAPGSARTAVEPPDAPPREQASGDAER